MPTSIMQLVTSVNDPSSVWIQANWVVGLNHRPSGLLKSCSAVSDDRLILLVSASACAPNKYTSQVKPSAALSPPVSAMRMMWPLTLPGDPSAPPAKLSL